MIHLVLLPLLVSAQASGSYYNGDDLPPNALKMPDEQLTGTVDLNLKKFKIATVKKGGAAVATAALSRAERMAIYYAFGSQPGGELDMLVEDAGKLTPVEVTWDGDTLNVKSGEARASIYGTAASKEALQKKFGVGAFVDSGARWDNDALFVVETALSKLTPDELKGIAGLPFHRMPKDPSAKRVRGTAIAMYVPDKGQIELYDYALEADKRKFYGSVEAPLPLSAGTVIHEAGHAIARASTRALRKQAEETKKAYDEINAKIMEEKKQYDADKAEYQRTKDPALAKALNAKSAALKPLLEDMANKRKKFEEVAAKMVMADRQGSPMEQSFDKTLPFRAAPTMYGRTAIGESFAECFALFKVDRAALERAAPDAIKWFESKDYRAFLAD
jgi:hypothetical protein